MQYNTQVVIIGGGPNGITLAHYMGLYGIDTIVLEIAEDILPYPRAVGMDDEALRVLQTVDMAEPALKDMIQDVPLRYFNAKGECFAEVKPTTRQYGWPMRNIFMQQLLEETLRQGLKKYQHIDLRLGHEFLSLTQDDEGVILTVKNLNTDEIYSIQAEFVIASDGGRSPVRKQLDINLNGLTHPHKWVVVDAVNDKLDAPYTALHADPERPFVCIYLPYQHRRWEFMLFEHEDETQMTTESTIRELIRKHIGDDVDQLEIVRIRAYTHNSRVAESFVKGRVALIGDAAHITPPWAGQGLNSGLRDVANLAWKVAAFVQKRIPLHLLDTYNQERREHAIDLIALADNMGVVLGLTDHLAAGVRDWLFQAFNTVDSLRSHLLEFKFKPRAHIHKGIVYSDSIGAFKDDPVGQLFIQPDVESIKGERCKLDTVMGKWFAIIGFKVNPTDYLTETNKKWWDRWDTQYIQVNRSRSGRRGEPIQIANISCVEDIDNKLAEWFTNHNCQFAIIRPDRFVAAITSTCHLNEAVEQIAKKLAY